MHRGILGAGLALAAAAALAATNAAAAAGAMPCPGAGAALIERFLSADCADCWSAAGDATVPARSWLFDWITPAGDDAPMSGAALTQALERALRAGAVPPAAAQRASRRPAVPPPSGLRLSIEAGPAWQGYIGVKLAVAGRLPAGASAWMALVELLPGGTDGSLLARQLLRTVSGPLPLELAPPSRRASHLAALRWPEGAKPERLQARVWIEDRDGRILAVAADRCAAPPA